MILNKNISRLQPIMFVGTGSDVGKSVIAAAFCRIFHQDGYHPAPFKAQNMALNSFATPDGLEIGRAQAVQAEAAGVPCETDMNPLLLKPTSDHQAQVVLHGKVYGNQGAYEYFRKEGRDFLRKEVCDAYDRLEKKYNPIVLEGAGSISEINLREVDLVNMPMAIHASAAVILIADIDRGGVFASVYGSIMLLNEQERKHIKGIIINKFRGDIRLFKDGIRMLEELCKIPVLGVVPYYKNIHIEDEDSLALSEKNRHSNKDKINVAVVLLRHLSNFTDFNALEHDPRIHLYYTQQPDEIDQADIIIIPGTKSTLADLHELRRSGMARAIIKASETKTVLGICGGYQIMGQELHDPQGVESNIREVPGLGLLPISTTLLGDKVTQQTRFSFNGGKTLCSGYEIHMGKTEILSQAIQPLTYRMDGTADGCLKNERCMGTYMHGILDNSEFLDFLLSPYINKVLQPQAFDYVAFKEEQYNKLADHVRQHVNINLIYNIIS